MRAPLPSLMPMKGHPTFIARSITLQTFSAKAPERLPPNTVKSCEKMQTWRPSMVPKPVTTPSPGIFLLAISKSVMRCVLNLSSSMNEPRSSSASMRSRAVMRPDCFCFARRSTPPPISARRDISCILSMFSLRPMLQIFGLKGRAATLKSSGPRRATHIDIVTRARDKGAPEYVNHDNSVIGMRIEATKLEPIAYYDMMLRRVASVYFEYVKRAGEAAEQRLGKRLSNRNDANDFAGRIRENHV